MGEAMNWTLVSAAVLASLAFGLLDAWLLLKAVTNLLMDDSALRPRVESSLETKLPRG